MKLNALRLLRQSLDTADAQFREGQWESIDAVLRGRKLLVVERTGWGKSMVYFLATRLLRERGTGPTLLISPLLSLMRNQLLAAKRLGIRAATINSSNTDEWKEIEKELFADKIDILMISPERLANEEFRDNVLLPVAERIGLFVVDEAHCISDWGHDFRPDYRRIVGVVRALPANLPVLATTATANDRVVHDVATQLGDLQVVRGPLIRESLRLQNIWLPSPVARMAWLAQYLPGLPGSGIVYTLTIRDAEQVVAWLRHRGIAAEVYHSDVADRETLEQRLLDSEVKALVSTVALGMGFDKPDLGFVIHFQRPGSVVHYYQQVGRAGRAVESAYGILMSGYEDDDIVDYFIRSAFPPQAHVDVILDALRDSDDGLSVRGLEERVNLRHGEIEKVLKLLSVETPSPVAKRGSRWHATPVDYSLDTDRIQQLCDLRRAEQRQMQEYMQTGECLMRFLAQALDDPGARACGKCANCVGHELVPTSIDRGLANEAALFLRRSHQPIPFRKRWPPGAFAKYAFSGSIEEALRAEEGRALSLWGDAGWGSVVKAGKYESGRFDDQLVEACEQLVRQWSPRPKPEWIACVPSIRHPDLVPDFSARLAKRLRVPFHPCIRQLRATEPQKTMENSFQQAHNLDGAFEVGKHDLIRRPVLLVDDMVDSGWTFTVLAALLRQAGCTHVFPLALAQATGR